MSIAVVCSELANMSVSAGKFELHFCILVPLVAKSLSYTSNWPCGRLIYWAISSVYGVQRQVCVKLSGSLSNLFIQAE